MKYYIDFQYLPKGASRPIDDGTIMPIEFDSGHVTAHLVPQVGDHVHLVAADGRKHAGFMGRVRSRLFIYGHNFDHPEDNTCGINIVVEEVEDSEWPKLIKE